MKRVVVVGGETHAGEVTQLDGVMLEIVGAAVREEQRAEANRIFKRVSTNYLELLDALIPEIVFVANENDQKAEVIIAALRRGMSVIVDKPLAMTMGEQEEIETLLSERPTCRLLNLLTLRGRPDWRGVRDAVARDAIGTPAFCHVRMAVQLKREQRPPWFLDYRRSGGLFLDLLIHGIDMVEWTMGQKIVAVSAVTGNLGFPEDQWLHDHATVFCELKSGASAVVEGQRMLPATKGSDYRMSIAGSKGVIDLTMGENVRITNPSGANQVLAELPEAKSIVADWLQESNLISQDESLRANRLAILAAEAARDHKRVTVNEVDPKQSGSGTV